MGVSKRKTSPANGGACLFDLDGTLASTARDLCDALNVMLRRRNMAEMAERDSHAAISRGGRALIARGFGIPFTQEGENAEMDALFDEFIAIYEQGLCVHSRLFPGVKAQLQRLREAGVALGVVTNKRESTARRLLEKLGVMHFFAVLVGGDSLEQRKPHPMPFFHALEILGARASDSVMVGDSRTDVDGARNAGLASIVVSFGYSDVAVEDLAADAILDDFGRLPQALRQLGFLGFAREGQRQWQKSTSWSTANHAPSPPA